MRNPMFFAAVLAASALLFAGCATKSANGGADADDSALMAGDGFGGAGAQIDPLDPSLAGNPDMAGAYGGRFDDGSRERIADAGLLPLYFTFDSYMLPGEEQAKAEAAAQYLLDHPGYVMIVEGHCDERGSNEYNLSLSEQRAIGVRDYMVSLGIDPNRLQTRAFGEEKPADPGHSDAAYRLNRRAEFVPYK